MADQEERMVVAGDVMTISVADFVRRCEVHIAEEQEKPLPRNALIAVLCEAVRLARESRSRAAAPEAVAADATLQVCESDEDGALKHAKPCTCHAAAGPAQGGPHAAS